VSFFFGIISPSSLYSFSYLALKAEKLRVGISMKTLNAPYFAAQGKPPKKKSRNSGAPRSHPTTGRESPNRGQGKAKNDSGFRQKKA
jgi:hypothetical protein